jgi:sporulation protein YlmC with PRC-barrel domain
MSRNPTTPQTHRGASRFRASQLIDCSVTNTHEEDLGDVQDIVLDRDNHSIAYVVVAFGGFLGMGDKYFAMPWRAIKVARRSAEDDPRISLAIDQEVLKKAPGFDKSKWPEMADASWSRQVDEYYSPHGDPSGGATPSSGPGHPPGGSRSDKSFGRDPDSDTFRSRRVSQLIGMEVVDANHESLAKVDDLVLDADQAQIEGVALTFGGVIGIGRQIALVPVESLTLDQDGESYVLPCTTDDLEALALPGGDWPELDSDDWLNRGRQQCDPVKGTSRGQGAPAAWKA